MNELRSYLESVVVKGDSKYLSRNGKYYHYDAAGKRTEITADQYKKALGPKSEPGVTAEVNDDNSVNITINGKTYKASHPSLSGQELADKVTSISKHSPGRAIQWLKKSGALPDTRKTTKVTPASI